MNKAHRLARTMAKSSRRLIGLMSGMSMDGVDLACAVISGDFPALEIKLIGTHFRPFAPELRARLIAAQTAAVAEVSELNFVVAKEFAECVREYLSTKQGLEIDAIGSHGQTLHHSSQHGASLQIGAPSIIAELTGIATIGNFRIRDLAAGGRGAPLVSLADYVLYRDPFEPVAVNNLGSIANLTIVTPKIEDLLAFDSGPANFAIDHFTRLVPGNHGGIDRDGEVSARGKIIPDLLKQFLSSPFLADKPPKAAGYGDFGNLHELAAFYRGAAPEDFVRTAVEFAAVTLAEAYRAFVFPRFPNLKKSWFSGGGVYNVTLMKRIKELLPELEVDVFEKTFADAKEALAFAILANETLSGRAGSFTATTGVRPDVVLGEIAV